MKCLNCGGSNFKDNVGLDKLLHVDGDAWVSPTASISICLDCGHLEFFNNGYAENYRKIVKANEEIEKEIKKKNKRIEEIKAQKFDSTQYQKEIDRLKEEIKTLESLGVSGKDIRARKDGIKENQRILDEKVDPMFMREIHQLENDIIVLQKNLIKID